MHHICNYKDFDTDFVENRGQDTTLPDNYAWIRSGIWNSLICKVSYIAIRFIASIYCRAILRIKVIGQEKLRHAGRGYFLFGNHTHPVADALLPVLLCSPRHIYTVVSPANLGLPAIGWLLPYIGALPVPSGIHRLHELEIAVRKRVSEGNVVVIYPEAHLWPYCTMIRPFTSGSFRYPVATGTPVFVITMTYQKRKHGRKPGMTAFIDGPFMPDKADDAGSARKAAGGIGQKVREAMASHSRENTCNYIIYTKTM